MPHIILKDVKVDFPVYAYGSNLFKNTVLNKLKLKSKPSIRSVAAVKPISLNLKDGDRLGVIGPNGSGKTTLLRTLAGVYTPTSGVIDISGKISSLLDISLGMDIEATGYENIRMRGIMMGLSLKEIKKIEDEIADFTELGAALELPIRTYSSGMHMRLGFAVSTSIPADIILMDEWLSVGDKNFQKKAEDRLKNYLSNSSILVIASHDENLLKKVTNKTLSL